MSKNPHSEVESESETEQGFQLVQHSKRVRRGPPPGVQVGATSSDQLQVNAAKQPEPYVSPNQFSALFVVINVVDKR